MDSYISNYISEQLKRNELEIAERNLKGNFWSVFQDDKELLHLKLNQGTSNLYSLIFWLLSGNSGSFGSNGYFAFTTSWTNYNNPTSGALSTFSIADIGSETSPIYYTININTTNNGSINSAVITSGGASNTAATIVGNFNIINPNETSDTITSIALMIAPAINSIANRSELTNTSVSIPYNPSIALTLSLQMSV